MVLDDNDAIPSLAAPFDAADKDDAKDANDDTTWTAAADAADDAKNRGAATVAEEDGNVPSRFAAYATSITEPYAVISVVTVGADRPLEGDDDNASHDDDDDDGDDDFTIKPGGSILLVSPAAADATEATNAPSSVVVWQLLLEEGPWRNNNNNNANRSASLSLPAWHSLALLSDVIVVVVVVVSTAKNVRNSSGSSSRMIPLLLPNDDDDDDWQWALAAGLRQRVHSGLARGRLLFIVLIEPSANKCTSTSNNNNNILLEQWRERLVLDELRSLTPDLLERLDIVEANNISSIQQLLLLHPAAANLVSERIMAVLHHHRDNNNNNQRGTRSIIDRASFVALLQQTYQSLGGRQHAQLWPLLPIIEHSRVINTEERLENHELVSSVGNDTLETIASVENGNEAEESVTSEDRILDEPAILSQKRGKLPLVQRAIGNFQRSRFRFDRKAKGESAKDGGPVMTTTKSVFKSPSDSDQIIMQSVFEQLNDLQARQEDNLLDSGSLPMDFASFANPIFDALASISEQQQSPGLDSILDRMRTLYQQHLEALRDHFGKVYETMLDHQADPASWDALKARVTSNFRQAAQQSVPVQAREGGIFRDADLDYVGALAGLAADLDVATDLRKELSGDDDDEFQGEIEVDSAGRARRKRFVKWCKKLAARGLMLGVNYLQGWLAWQGIKRTALERERSMPKFPLF